MSEENSNAVASSEPGLMGPADADAPSDPEQPTPAEAEIADAEPAPDAESTGDPAEEDQAGPSDGEDAPDEGEAAGEEGQAAAAPETAQARWYAIHVYSGFEQKVLKNIQYRLDIDDLNQYVARLLVPTHNVVEIKDGKKVQSQKNLMPGYVLIEMLYNEDVIDTITKLGGVAGFVGDGTKPTAMSNDQVEGLLAQTSHRQDKPKAEVLFDKGEQVKIIEGPFAGFTGQVSEIDATRGKLSVMVSIFGRQTAVELDVLQVDKV